MRETCIVRSHAVDVDVLRSGGGIQLKALLLAVDHAAISNFDLFSLGCCVWSRSRSDSMCICLAVRKVDGTRRVTVGDQDKRLSSSVPVQTAERVRVSLGSLGRPCLRSQTQEEGWGCSSLVEHLFNMTRS